MKQVGMDIVPARNLGNVLRGRQALLDDPSLLSPRPSSAPFGT
jgi:hypothetical protein